jgi:pentatricopeptide repeat protein
MVAVYARQGRIDKADLIIAEMRDQELPIGSAPYTTILAHYHQVNNPAKFKQVWTECLADPTTELEPVTAGLALRFFRKQRDFAVCEQIFNIHYPNFRFGPVLLPP